MASREGALPLTNSVWVAGGLWSSLTQSGVKLGSTEKLGVNLMCKER